MKTNKIAKAKIRLSACSLLLLFFMAFLSLKNLEAKEKNFVPHRRFTSTLCEDCHRYLASFKGEFADFCLFCHNGSFGQRVSDTFSGTYLHYGENCLGCHSPHLVASQSPGLLKAKGNTGADFCFACHYNQTTETVSTSKAKFFAGVHNFPSPGKSKLSCLNCHLPHSSSSSKMEGFRGQDGFQGENLCFACHQKVESQFYLVSRHAVANKEVGLECVSCHNPHFTSTGSLSDPDNTFEDQEDEVNFCLTCHDGNPPQKTFTTYTQIPYSINFPSFKGPFFSGWDKLAYYDSAHARTKLGKITCLTCHLPHGSSNFSLLGFKGRDKGFEEEKLCLACHQIGTSAKEVVEDFKKSSRHPIEKENLHRSNEDMTGLAYDPKNSKRHSECYDCHNPHQATIDNPLAGTKGVDLRGRIKDPIENTYELCFKCHTSYTLLPPRAEDLRQSFNPLNPSYHPVVESGKNPINSSAFNSSYSDRSRIDCLDCHGNDAGERRVHGSKFSPLLQKPVEKEKPDTAKSLCFKCHKFSVYTSSSSLTRFPNHFQHAAKFACLLCHQPHGSLKPALLKENFVYNNKLYKFSFSLEGKTGSCQVSPAGPCHGQKTYERSY